VTGECCAACQPGVQLWDYVEHVPSGCTLSMQCACAYTAVHISTAVVLAMITKVGGFPHSWCPLIGHAQHQSVHTFVS
jgi:hypothetical protein